MAADGWCLAGRRAKDRFLFHEFLLFIEQELCASEQREGE